MQKRFWKEYIWHDLMFGWHSNLISLYRRSWGEVLVHFHLIVLSVSKRFYHLMHPSYATDRNSDNFSFMPLLNRSLQLISRIASYNACFSGINNARLIAPCKIGRCHWLFFHQGWQNKSDTLKIHAQQTESTSFRSILGDLVALGHLLTGTGKVQ